MSFFTSLSARAAHMHVSARIQKLLWLCGRARIWTKNGHSYTTELPKKVLRFLQESCTDGMTLRQLTSIVDQPEFGPICQATNGDMKFPLIPYFQTK